MGANNALNNMTGTALVTNKAASTTYTLTAGSQNFQLFTNSGFVTGALVQLPVTSTLMIGRTFTIFNYDSVFTMAVNSSGGNLIATIPANSFYTFMMVDPTLTTAAGWMTSGQPPVVASTSSSPTVSFSTPGNLTVSYSVQSATLSRTGNVGVLQVDMRFTPTFTTASGNIIIGNLPTGIGSSFDAQGAGGVLVQNGISGVVTPFAYPASTTMVLGNLQSNFGSPIIQLQGSGTAIVSQLLGTTQFPTAQARYFRLMFALNNLS